MQKIIFGIFAHPDDEAFCVAGTLLKEVAAGAELHLITLTAGENGMNPDDVPDLGETRLNEWRAAGKLIGATSQQHFGYEDGTLGNSDHVEITNRIENHVRELIAERSDTVVEFMSLDLNGLTGHIDHIVAARSACLAFYRLKKAGLPMTRIRLACLAEEDFPEVTTDFTLWQPGLPAKSIDETIDMRPEAEKVFEIMHAHRSQRSDASFWIDRLDNRVAINHFIIKN